VIKKLYCYRDGNHTILSHDIPERGIIYIEKTIGLIGVPDLRAVSIKNSDGILLYNELEKIPLENYFIENYFIEVNKK
jgi:hypothetical protein